MGARQQLMRDVSDTALWVAAYRADESDRGDALFHDRLARTLAGERGAEMARRVRNPAIRIGVVLRTALMDEAIEAAVVQGWCDTVLNLGAGLDARPYRLALPRPLRWLEVDLPGLMASKDAALAVQTPSCTVERIGLDLAEVPSRRRLLESLLRESRGVLVVTEGLLGYLEREQVASLAEDLHAQHACRAWLTDLVGANVTRRVRSAGDEMKAPQARATFAPPEGTAFFEPHGWREAEYRDAFVEAPRLGRDSLAGKAVRAVVRHLPEERRKRFERGMGVVRLERL